VGGGTKGVRYFFGGIKGVRYFFGAGLGAGVSRVLYLVTRISNGFPLSREWQERKGRVFFRFPRTTMPLAQEKIAALRSL